MHYRFLILAQDAAANPAPESKSILGYVASGGPLSYVLVLVSLAALSLIIRNMILFNRNRLAPPAVFDRLSGLLRENDIEGALAYCSAPENNSFLTRVFGTALLRCSRSPFGFLELRSALEESGSREADRLHRANEGIGIFAAIGPMLGLLGTVIGMIGAFAAIGNLEGSARSHELAKFMSYALVNTAEGLVVAIPCTIAFSLFRRHIDHLVGQIAEQIEALTRYLEQTPGDDRQRPAAPPRAASAPRPLEPARGAQA